MTVKTDANGRRSVQVEVEVPGTPEEVWQAIATGPGISSWFVPAVFEERDGTPVALTLSFGPGMDSRSIVTSWDPSRKTWAAQTSGWVPGSPPIANEWSVDARAGGVCIVRIVHALVATTDEWDHQLEGTEAGWPAFFRTLQLYLAHFRGQFATTLKVMAPAPGTEAEVWATLTSALGVTGTAVGQRATAPGDAPSFSGVLEHLSADPNDALVRLEQPGPGVGSLGTFRFPGSPTMVAINLFLFGDQAAEIVAHETPRWEAWFQEHFPMPTEESASE